MLIVASLLAVLIAGIMLFVAACRIERRANQPGPWLPPARIVGSGARRSARHTPPPVFDPTTKPVSVGRLVGGMVLIAIGGMGLLFIYGVAGLAHVTWH